MKYKMMSRVHFCEKCYAHGDPHDGQMFAVHGSTTDTIWLRMYQAPYKREERLPCGFTPHLFVLDQVLPSGNLQVRLTCCMGGCGIEINMKPKENVYEYFITDERFILLTKKEWEVLETFTDSGYKL